VISSSVSTNLETSNVNWQWSNWQGLPYLTCSLLKDWQHGFFTQQFFPQTPESLVKVLGWQVPAYRVKQVHGKQVLPASEVAATTKNENELIIFPDADAIVSDRERQAVWVATADCTPLLIGDVQTGKVAAIHAGWRGTALKIVPEAIALFQASGSVKENLRIAMGPAINGEVYQVTEQVAVEIGRSIIENADFACPEDILQTLKEFPDSPILKDEHPGRVRLDVRRINAIQLEKLGIDSTQIAIAPFCTYQQPEFFFSYRRTKEKKVQWSGIVS
jgi:hypothetical protein